MKPIVKILVVDDDEDDYIIMREYIAGIAEQEFSIEWCGNYVEAGKKITAGEYDLYFVDYLLGAKTGLELIKELTAGGCQEPMILLTGNGNRTIDMQAMQSGAVDYLVKTDLNTEKLERCIRYSLERSSNMRLLKSQERKFRNIFERSKDTVFIAGSDLRFIEINDAAVALLGYSKAELQEKNLYSLCNNKEDADFITAGLLKDGLVLDKEMDVLTKEGEIKNGLITLSRQENETGDFYFQGIIHEITALKKAEKATLTIEKMKMANRLLRTMAHEVRNPLNNIMLSVEQLNAITKNDETGLYLEMIERNGKRISNLITELLNSSGPAQINVLPKSLQSILDESIDAAYDRMSLQNIKLVKDFITEDAIVLADVEKLKIAFLNIIINAIESMEKDSGTLNISLKRKNGTQYTVVIQDNGCGISNDNLVKLFEPYFTTKKNGLGLGLASTLNILRSHDASVDVDSQLKKGTVFKLFFKKA